MNLETTYMGLKLKNPLVLSSSPLTRDVGMIRRLEDAGIAAVVCHSIFEEQLAHEALELDRRLRQGTESYAEALSYFPEPEDFKLGPEAYLDLIRLAKKAVKIPIIASLNGHTEGGWTSYARQVEQAGADAIELNVYFLATHPDTSAEDVEKNYEAIVRAVRSSVKIPVSVKLSPYFSALTHFAKRLDAAGADAMVLFNRFYQPDIDLDTMEVVPNILLSNSYDLRLPLRWIAILHGRIKASLAATSGIHHGEDVVKMILAGADVVMLCAALLERGVDHVSTILRGMEDWMADHGYDSVSAMKGVMSQQSCAHPEAFERANYMKVLNSGSF